MEQISSSGRVSVYYGVRNWLLTLRRDYGAVKFVLGMLLHFFILGPYYIVVLTAKNKRENIPPYFKAIFDALLNKTPNRYIKQ